MATSQQPKTVVSAPVSSPKTAQPKPASVPVQADGGKFQKVFRFLKLLVLGEFLLWGGVILPAVLFFAYSLYFSTPNRWSQSQTFVHKVNTQTYFSPTRTAACNVLATSLTGFLETYTTPEETGYEGTTLADVSNADYIVSAIQAGEEDVNIQAHLIEIDSGGGYPVAGEEIARALTAAKKPTVAVIRQLGASAAYMAAAAADYIFASRYSEVGSIGLTASYVDQAKKNEKDGLTYNELSTGKYKDLFSPDKTLTNEERALVERDLKIGLENFISDIATNRHLDVDVVRTMADGSTMTGTSAKEKGLIDEIGGLPEATAYLRDKIGTEVELCW